MAEHTWDNQSIGGYFNPICVELVNFTLCTQNCLFLVGPPCTWRWKLMVNVGIIYHTWILCNIKWPSQSPHPFPLWPSPPKLWSKHVTERTLACRSVESIDTFSWQAKLVTNIGVLFSLRWWFHVFLKLYVNAALFGGWVEQQRGSVTLEKPWSKHGVSRTSFHEAPLGLGRRRVSWEATTCFLELVAIIMPDNHLIFMANKSTLNVILGAGHPPRPPQTKNAELDAWKRYLKGALLECIFENLSNVSWNVLEIWETS